MFDYSTGFNGLDSKFSKPIPATHHQVVVELHMTDMANAYVQGILFEMARVMPNQWDMMPISSEEMHNYIIYIISERVKAIHGSCANWRADKELWIPSFIQYLISQMGEVFVADKGILVTCELADKVDYSLEDALKVNQKLRLYAEEMKSFHQDAFPRGKEGSLDFMVTAVIEGVVRSLSVLSHPAVTLLTAFTDMRVVRVDDQDADSVFLERYDQRYDEVPYIKSVFSSQAGVI